MTKRVTVLGETGLLGHMLINVLRVSSQFEVTTANRDNWLGAIYSLREGDYLVNALGRVPQRGTDAATMLRVNAKFPHELAKNCEIRGAKMLHLSSDCCYAGD